MVAPHQVRSRAARVVPLITVVLVVACALVAPAGALRHASRSTTGNMSYVMSWGGELLIPFAKASRPPGLRSPSIDGLLVACTTGSAASTPDGTGLDIRYKTLGGKSSLWGGPGDQLHPAVSDGLIAGLDQGLIGVFDPATGTAVTVSDAAAQHPFAPAFDGSVVVWEDHRNGSSDIYARAFDRASGQPTGDAFPICTAPGDQTNPAIDGHTVVWQDARDGGSDIYAYDLTDQREYAVGTAPGDQTNPDVSGDLVVWQDSRRGQWDIYAYDLAKAEELPVCLERRAQTHPAASGDLIVWQDGRPRWSQRGNEPARRYLSPHMYAYSIPAKHELGEIWGSVEDNRETLAAVSGLTAVYEDNAAQAGGVTRISGVKVSGVWAYGFSISPASWYVNAPELTFDIQVDSCPTPPVAQVGIGVSTTGWWQGDLPWQPFAPRVNVSLPGGDGRKYWEFSLKDSAGDSDGSTGSYVVLDTHGPSCWTPYPVTVRSGGTAILHYKVTDKLSTGAKATIAIVRQDGTVVQTLPARWVATGKLAERKIDCDLIPCVYQLRVTATDMAGNEQVRVGTTRLTVK